MVGNDRIGELFIYDSVAIAAQVRYNVDTMKRAPNIPNDDDETVSTSLRLTKKGEILRAMIAKSQGVNKTAAVELALRHYAEFLGLTVDGNPEVK